MKRPVDQSIRRPALIKALADAVSMLEIVGFDYDTPDDYRRMWKRHLRELKKTLKEAKP